MSGNRKEICRTCLTGERSLLPLSTSFEFNVTVADYFRTYLNYEFKTAKELPEVICLKCLDTLFMIKQFYTQCKESEEYLERKYQNKPDDTKESDIKLFEDEISLDENIITTMETAFVSEEDFKDEDFIHCNLQSGSGNKINSNNEIEKEMYIEYECKECGECFDSEDIINEHWKIFHERHKDDKPQKEDISFEIGYLETDLHDPLTNLDNENYYHCSKCKKSFEYKDVYDEHMTKHEYKLLSTKCPKCDKTYSSTQKLRKHFREVHLRFIRTKSQKPYECTYCEKKYFRKDQMKIHQRTHTGERPFKCTYCGKGFTQKNCLTTHLTLHTGKPIKCPLCDKHFSRKSLLNVHTRSHNNDRPFICDQCPKRYFQITHLRDHQRTHTGERPFSCQICGKSFHQRSTLDAHMFSHGKPKPFRCPLCLKEFITAFLYRKHIAAVHNIEEDTTTYVKTFEAENSQEPSGEYIQLNEVCKINQEVNQEDDNDDIVMEETIPDMSRDMENS